jgi:sentrin-specific protease 7
LNYSNLFNKCRICRESILSGNQVYFSSSYFFQKLDDDGPEGVASWIRKKEKIIDVFGKKFIFVPVNSDLHWSLCVVVNLGHILKAHQLKDGSLIESKKDGEWPW